ncbi:MAG: inorganic phosphate transporter [Deltaproteobacteria bacterium]|nr:inorganic phosphate transporter [Deltaproteobacteria bacterium]
MTSVMWMVVIGTVVAALVFDVINGFHDAANSIATVVSTRVLSPRVAVLWAAFFNFIAMLVFAPKVADTISKIVKINAADHAYVYVVLCGLLGAIVWDLVTWWWALPTSSSHALIGGFAGAGVAYAGWDVLRWEKLLEAVKFIPLAPLIGFGVGLVLMLTVYWLFRRWRPAQVDKLFRRGQLLSAALYSLGHGGNDAQKTMGIIVALLVASGAMNADVELSLMDPSTLWIILSCHAAMGIGTALGGWRIVRTMGMKITKLKPVGGFCAETGGAFTLFFATHLGVPVSTTHTITGAIIGVGSITNLSGIKWGVAGRIVIAWLVTIPASAVVAAGGLYLARRLVGF